MKNNNLQYRHLKEKVIFGILGLTLLAAIGILGLIIYFIFSKGIGVISIEFLTQMPIE